VRFILVSGEVKFTRIFAVKISALMWVAADAVVGTSNIACCEINDIYDFLKKGIFAGIFLARALK